MAKLDNMSLTECRIRLSAELRLCHFVTRKRAKLHLPQLGNPPLAIFLAL